ncbi:M56 family metallopeptidase [Chitinophaga rhizophila]|uniref:M56 family metallopeptidase n=1 Tax=Chitinophaga rhizophila TaxID=2866212 RepID=A0ABS7GAE2_9BACT|nr:M56 family metallopeptidase [Chitinophaga rhizophila]MBW8684110.1 M56 family metallopeptidase [Chitinophaga rhizophila]
MLIYLLKANIALVLFYLAYYFGLRRLTFYTLNRFFLVGGILCAAVCPLIDPSLFIREHHELNAVAISYIPDLSTLKQHPSEPFINTLLKYVFWSGVVIMSVRLMVQLFSLWGLHRQTNKTIYENESLRIMEKQANPFSFLRNIYINPSLHTPDELVAIIRHEKIHVQQWHSLDVLLGELNKIFYWFNPGAWLMSVAIRENLEFITDRSILRQGIDAKAYQYSLIKVSGIPYATAIANNFNFSHLKQRIMMMNKKRSSRYNLLRYVVLGAVMGIAVLSLNFTRAIAGVETSAKQLAVVFHPDTTEKDALPPPPPAPPVPPAPPAPPPPVKGKAKVSPPAIPAAPAAIPAPAAAPAPAATPAPAPADESLTMAVAAEPAPQADPGKASVTLRNGGGITKKPLYLIDDVIIGNDLPEGMIDGKDIACIFVEKDEVSIQKYGEAGKNGVVRIYTIAHGAPPANANVQTSASQKTAPATLVSRVTNTPVAAPGALSIQGNKHRALPRGISLRKPLSSHSAVTVTSNGKNNVFVNGSTDVKSQINVNTNTANTTDNK